MALTRYLILFVALVLAEAWMPPQTNEHFIPTRAVSSKFAQVLNPTSTCWQKYQHQNTIQLSLSSLNSQSSNPSKPSKKEKAQNVIQSCIKFFLLQLRRFLYPNLSRNFDSNVEEPLPPLAPLGCPFLGNNILAGSQKRGPEYFYSKASAYLGHPRVWRFYFMGQPVVSVSGSKNMNAILQNKKFNIVSYVDETKSEPSAKRKKKRPALFSSNSVMFEADRDRHQFLRHLIGAAFKPKAVQAAMPKLVEAADQQISTIRDEETIMMETLCESFTLDIAWRQIIGLDLQNDEREILRFHKAVNRYVSGVFSIFMYLDLPGKTLTPPFRAREYLVRKIKERIVFLEKNGPDGSTLSAMVFSSEDSSEGKVGSNDRLSHDEIIENALILLVAGTETTASTLTSAIYFLGLHPHVWDKLVREQRDMISKHGTEITKEFVGDCDYLNAVIKETMRIVPVSGLNLRRSEEMFILDGKQIPKGTSVFCNVRLTHELDPSVSSSTLNSSRTSAMDPRNNFLPERWLDSETKPSDDFMPFGAGTRRCLGSSLAMGEMRAFLSVLARRISKFDLVTSDSGHDIRWKPTSIIPKPVGGVAIRASQ